jgi:predicted hydrocarbon binding protein
MGEKVMVDFPGFITRDSKSMHLLVGDDSHVLLSDTIIAEMYRRLCSTLGYENAARIIYDSAKKGSYEVQKKLIVTYKVALRNENDLRDRIARLPLYIQTYGHGRGKTVRQGADYVFEVKYSSVGECLKNQGMEKPTCHFLAGFFAGMAEAYAEQIKPGVSYSCVETRCVAVGDPCCEFSLFASFAR